MADVLEIIMLICFGLSWPTSLYKNIKLKSAKAMSLKFTLMIFSGYIAGISAKIISHNFSYAFWVYILNIAFVAGNIAVYFINKQYDNSCENTQIA